MGGHKKTLLEEMRNFVSTERYELKLLEFSNTMEKVVMISDICRCIGMPAAKNIAKIYGNMKQLNGRTNRGNGCQPSD